MNAHRFGNALDGSEFRGHPGPAGSTTSGSVPPPVNVDVSISIAFHPTVIWAKWVADVYFPGALISAGNAAGP